MSGIPMLIPKWILKKIGFTGTKSEVQAAISSGRIKDGDTVTITDDSADELTALSVSYDNTTSGMSATSVQGAVDELNNDLTTSSVQSLQLSNTRPKSDGVSNDYFKIYKCGKVVTVFFDIALSSIGIKRVATLPEGYRPPEFITGCIPRFENSSAMQYISFDIGGAVNVYCDNIDSRLMFMYTFITP